MSQETYATEITRYLSHAQPKPRRKFYFTKKRTAERIAKASRTYNRRAK